MHMADALISPAVGGACWAASAGGIAYCARRVAKARDDRLVPMMGVLGAFVFAAQMVNFSIPVTGSSGHIGGGLLLAILLGPHAAFVVIASVLAVQALFFMDGGLLALGCNILNLGFFPAFLAYALVYRPLAGKATGGTRLWIASVVAAVVGLQLGAFGVVAETTLSGISELPFGTFLLLMQPIHLAIGAVEGLATAAVVAFVAGARPEALAPLVPAAAAPANWRPVVVGLALAAVVIGGVGGWFASSHPDGLEWSIAKATGQEEIAGAGSGLHEKAAAFQQQTALMPDYGFRGPAREGASADQGAAESAAWPAVEAGTSVAGLVGGGLVLVVAGLLAILLRPRKARAASGS